MSIRITWSVADDGVRFSASRSGAPYPISLPVHSLQQAVFRELDDPAFGQLSALEDLRLAELIEDQGPGRWLLRHEALYKALRDEPEALTALGLPHASPVVLSVRSVGATQDPQFHFEVETHHEPYGRLEGAHTRKGGIYLLPGNEVLLLEEPVFRLMQEAEAAPDAQTTQNPRDARMVYQARVQRAARDAGAQLEPWFEREHYHFPTGIGVDIEQVAPDELRLSPRAEGVGIPGLQNQLKRRLGQRAVLWTADGETRHRMILDDAQKDTANYFTEEHRTISGASVPRFFETPEAFLPEGIDLSTFSSRVKGIIFGAVEARPCIRMRKGKYAWFPELHVTLDELQTMAIELAEGPIGQAMELLARARGSEEDQGFDPEVFERLARETLETGEPYILYEGQWIHIAPALAEQYIEARRAAAHMADGVANLPPGRARLDIFQNLDQLEYQVEEEEEEQPAEVEEKLDEDSLRDVLEYEPPSLLDAELYPYQVYGYNWLRTLDTRHRGGLLADDMGLGKTLQAIALLSARKEDGALSPSLAVMPKTLIANWDDEIAMFCPSIKVLRWAKDCPLTQDFLSRYDLVLVSYDSLRRNVFDFARIDWKVIICDEAQYVKNPSTGRTDAVKSLKGEMRIALTGTPIENGLPELWCIMEYVQPGILGALSSFRQQYERPIVLAEDPREREQATSTLLAKIVQHYLRRRKAQILKDLPPKLDEHLYSPLTPEQVESYESMVRQARYGGRGSKLATLQKLLLLCSYPWLDAGDREIEITDDLLVQCPKMKELRGILERVRERDEKALIFLERKNVQRLLRGLIRHWFGIAPILLNGEFVGSRKRAVDDFNKSRGFDVMILSPKVGGTGLNITSANHVVHYMRPWNPAIENQATDRTHRIGQKKQVTVYYPIATCDRFDTVEQVLHKLLQDKRALAEDVLVPSSKLRVTEQELMDRVYGTSA